MNCDNSLFKPYDKDKDIILKDKQIKMLIKERDFLMKSILGWCKSFEDAKMFLVANEMNKVLLKCKQIEQELIIS